MRLTIRIFLFFILSIFILSFTTKSYKEKFPEIKEIPPFENYHSQWAKTILKKLTLKQKLGQMMMVSAYPMQSEKQWEKLGDVIEKYHIGGIIVFKGTPYRTARMINYLQTRAKVPLMVAIDGEWGVSMRIDSVVSFPQQMQLGAIRDNSLIYQFGESVAAQCKRLGIQINFAPDADINNNPKNPVINSRSFGELRENVAQKTFAYASALQNSRILAVAKHFPGHGDTESDSHKSLPVIKASKARLDSLELYPFKFLISKGIAGIMTAHLYIPALDTTKHISASISPLIIDTLLKKKLQFKGLIFTDALGMQGVAKYHTAGEIERMAVQAGNDVLLMPKNVQIAIDSLMNAVKNNEITEKRIDYSVKKILNTKFWFGLSNYKPANLANITEDLNSETHQQINHLLVENSLTLMQDSSQIIPLKNLDKIKVASIEIGGNSSMNFSAYLQRYMPVSNFKISKYQSQKELNIIENRLKKYDLLIVSVFASSRYSKGYGIPHAVWNSVNKIAQKHKLIFVNFSNAYTLANINKSQKLKSIIEAYDNTLLNQDLAAQLIFGGISANGRLPVSAGKFKAREGEFSKKIRLKYALPAEVNLSENDFKSVDSIILDAIKKKATPGCQVLAIKNGVVFFNKSYGFHTYEQKQEVKNTDLYDLASLTKVTATLPTLMHLYEQGKFDINARLKQYLPETDTTNKGNIIIKSILAHQARLKDWIPFYLHTLDKQTFLKNKELYRTQAEKGYTTQVAENLYILDTYRDSMYAEILNSKLRRRTAYRYSDLGFYMFKRIIEKETSTPLNKLVDSLFYAPLGAYHLGYLPLAKFSKQEIIPTEDDHVFRNQLLDGYVHDYGAAMLGGVGGHAGLFSNANDLAKMAQMYLNGGVYADKRYLEASTLELFRKRPYRHNRRALGFDRKPLSGTRSVAGSLASKQSFGHSGFTGTLVWIDPKNDFIFIFLSNRINPNIQNTKLLHMNIRSKVHNEFYKAILKKKKKLES